MSRVNSVIIMVFSFVAFYVAIFLDDDKHTLEYVLGAEILPAHSI